MNAAKMAESKTHLIPGKLCVSELVFQVPKDWSNPTLGSLRIFARSVTKHERPVAPVSDAELHKKEQKPWFVYLQGGPGYGCQPPKSMPITDLILEKGYKLLYVDQRGTGLSTPITADTLALHGSVQKQVDYLKLFRADSIVKDLEAIRKVVTDDYPQEIQKWSILGQSYGGFCALTYLSMFPGGLQEVFISGGIPPIGKTAVDVYEATFKTVIRRNEIYYQKYPEDVETIHNIASYIDSKGGISLPSGGTLTVPRFLTLGLLFGAEGGIDTIHNLVFRMRSDLVSFDFMTRPTLSEFERTLSFDDAVIYAVLHESIYCEGNSSNWAAERVGKMLKEFSWIDGTTSSDTKALHPLYFSGEMVFSFMFDTSIELKSLREAAEMIAQCKEWPDLYDVPRLAKNEVPVFAAIFVDDMYVDYGLVQETVKGIKNCKLFITNTMYHDAVHSRVETLIEELFKLRDDSLD